MNEQEKNNRERLIAILNKIENQKCPVGWKHTASIAVGGLTEIGFSKKSEMLLIVSSQGRGVINCVTGEKISRDRENDGIWLRQEELLCEGIGPLIGELIQISGLNGGGLPITTIHGESIEVVAPNWPILDLIFCSNYKSALIEGHQSSCKKIASDYFRAYGFSWSGNSFAFATGSDVDIFTRT